MSLIIRDLKSNLKPFIYWILGVGILIAILVLAYPVAIEKMSNLGDVINSMPRELIVAFGLESYDWSKVLNYLAYEFQFIFLACGIYAVTIGSSIFSKEETNKTIELIYSKPITRNHIFFSKLFTATFTILLFNIVLFLITTIFLLLGIKGQVVDINALFNMYVALFLIQLIFMSLGMLIAVVMKKSKAAAGIVSGLVIFTFMVGMFSKITEAIKNLIYISPLHYFTPDQIVKTGEFGTKYLILTACIVVFSILVSWKVYQRKDFNI